MTQPFSQLPDTPYIPNRTPWPTPEELTSAGVEEGADDEGRIHTYADGNAEGAE